MTFAEKLDFFLNITKTSNSALAHAALLDASYISRLRSGKRLMPKLERRIEPYFYLEYTRRRRNLTPSCAKTHLDLMQPRRNSNGPSLGAN